MKTEMEELYFTKYNEMGTLSLKTIQTESKQLLSMVIDGKIVISTNTKGKKELNNLIEKIENRNKSLIFSGLNTIDVLKELCSSTVAAISYMKDPMKQNCSEKTNIMFYEKYNIPYKQLKSRGNLRYEFFNGQIFIGKTKQTKKYSTSMDFIFNDNILSYNKYLGGLYGYTGGTVDHQVDGCADVLSEMVKFYNINPNSTYKSAILVDGPELTRANSVLSVPADMKDFIFVGTHPDFFCEQGKYLEWTTNN